MRVLGVLASLLPLIKKQYPDITDNSSLSTSLIPLIKTQYSDITDNSSPSQSSDASCLFGVIRFIVYIHYLNEELESLRRRGTRDDWTLTFLSLTLHAGIKGANWRGLT
jgi:hypothetical protein